MVDKYKEFLWNNRE